MSLEEKFFAGQPALLDHELPETSELDVLVVGINPSFSARTFSQLYLATRSDNEPSELVNCLLEIAKKNGQHGLLPVRLTELLNGCSKNPGHWEELKRIFSVKDESVKQELESDLSRLQYLFLNGSAKPKEPIWFDVMEKRRSIPYFDRIRDVLRVATPPGRSLSWYHIDLFDDRETEQKRLVRTRSSSEWEKAVGGFWKKVEEYSPKILLVANGTVMGSIFTNFEEQLLAFGQPISREPLKGKSFEGLETGKSLEWNSGQGAMVIKSDGETVAHPKVVFSRQLSGGASNAMKYYVAREIRLHLMGRV